MGLKNKCFKTISCCCFDCFYCRVCADDVPVVEGNTDLIEKRVLQL